MNLPDSHIKPPDEKKPQEESRLGNSVVLREGSRVPFTINSSSKVAQESDHKPASLLDSFSYLYVV